MKTKSHRSRFLSGTRIYPKPITKGMKVTDLMDSAFLAYNSARLQEAGQVYTKMMLEDDVTIGMTLTGALTPAGVGRSCIIPLMKAGFVDWIISTGANLYHDAHFGLGLALHKGSPYVDDTRLRQEEVVRIYDILFDYHVLLSTDAFFREIIEKHAEFQREMSTAEFHYIVGKFLKERERVLGIKESCILTVAHDLGVPIYTSSPGDSSIGMNVAAMALRNSRLRFDVNADVNETASIVYNAKKSGGKHGVMLIGGGSPKNFMLQTEPQIQEVLGLDEKGHDYFIQITDARPDTGGLSGATPSEAVSWGKVDASKLPDTVVCYTDSTIALPLLTAYAMDNHKPRKPKRLFDRRAENLNRLRETYLKRVNRKK